MYFKARAKLNLSLNVLGASGDMHLIESVLLPIELFDDVIVEPNGEDKINLRYNNRGDLYDNDTALFMAESIKDKYRTPGVDIEIYKRIPERAGLGGSSADAAAVARAMASLFGLDITSDVLLSVGSDVPAMFLDRPCIVSGKGENTKVLDKAIYPNVAVLLVEGGVDTGACYSRFDKLGGENADTDEIVRALESGRNFVPHNALTKAAISLNPSIGQAMGIMKKFFPGCGMTGSGSAIFGIEYDEIAFKKNAENLHKAVGDKYEIITLSKEQ